VSAVAPKATFVVPKVTELFVSELLSMFVSVLLEPLMVLFVSVCVPVSVATVLSIAIVTGTLPLKLVPVKPVPMVSAFGVAAVIVVLPPKLTALPLIVTELFVSCKLVINPLRSVVGMVLLAVRADVPLPFT
jgi:hypothetical protein